MILLIQNVTVPSGYDYITGTVNGTDTTFIADTIIEGLCLCSCEENSSYEVEMNFYDDSDELLSTVTTTVTQAANSFIVDRTQDDVDYAKRMLASQRASVVENLKGCLNRSDLQRALDNCAALAILDDETMSSDTIPEFPGNNFFQILLDNAELAKESGFILSDTPDVPQLTLNTYDKWNKLERIFWDNFDIRTSRFKYFGPELDIREVLTLNPLVIVYNNVAYQFPIENIIDLGLPSLDNQSIREVLLGAQSLLGYEYVATNTIRTVDGTNDIRIVDGTDDIRKVDE